MTRSQSSLTFYNCAALDFNGFCIISTLPNHTSLNRFTCQSLHLIHCSSYGVCILYGRLKNHSVSINYHRIFEPSINLHRKCIGLNMVNFSILSGHFQKCGKCRSLTEMSSSVILTDTKCWPNVISTLPSAMSKILIKIILIYDWHVNSPNENNIVKK